jgi:hypothetical protein
LSYRLFINYKNPNEMKLTKNIMQEKRQNYGDKPGCLRSISFAWEKKALLFLHAMAFFTLLHFCAYSQALTSVSSASGSLARWGESQGLQIDAVGNTTVLKQDVETGAEQIVTVVLTPAQMQAIADTAYSAGFFSLNPSYDSNSDDGSGISLEIITPSDSNMVIVRNACVTAINRVVKTINLQIISTGIQLSYGYLNEVCP